MNGDSRRIVILVIVALVCIACLCGCCVALGVGAELYSRRLVVGTPTAPTPAMRLPGPRVAPGRTPGAVATVRAAPPSPPSATAPPASGAPAGSLSPEEQAYVAGFDDQSQRWADSRQKFDTLMAAPKPADDGWKNDVLAQFSAWQGLASQAGGLPAVPRFAAAQQRYSQAAQHFAAAALLGADGLARQNTAALDSAKSEIAAGDTALNEARAQVAASKR